MRRYETIFILRPNAGEEQISAVSDRVCSIITGDGGTLITRDAWGLRKLAYLIDKQSQGYYVHLDYAGTPAAVAELERILRIEDAALKYMTVKLADSCDPEAVIAEAARKAAAAAEKKASEDEEEEDGDD